MPSRRSYLSITSWIVSAGLFCAVAFAQVSGVSDEATATPAVSAEERWAQGDESGELVYQTHCSRCHRSDGKGMRTHYPPVAKSDFIAANPKSMIPIVLLGLSGPIVVNGVTWDTDMPPIDYLSDRELANALTFVLNEWGNPGGKITPEEVGAYRKSVGLKPNPGK